MKLEELEHVCREAARDLLARHGRPVPVAVVLPLPSATKVTTFPDFPDDDPTRFDLLSSFAEHTMRPAGAPCYGFLAEAVVEDVGESAGADPVDALVVAFGAIGVPPRVMAAPLRADELDDFTESEQLDDRAMPFLAPLRHAAESVTRGPDAGEAADPLGINERGGPTNGTSVKGDR